MPAQPDNQNAAEFCDPAHRPADRAGHAQTRRPTRTRPAALWERVDRETVDQAPWVPLVNPRAVDVLSKRVGNYQYSPAGLGVLIDQLWVR